MDATPTSRTYFIEQHSFTASALQPGLYLVPTPIGNLGDVTLRSLQVLAAVDLLYCEDTRVTPKLLDRFGIKVKLRQYHDHNSDEAGKSIIAEILSGKSVGLASDAGTPLLSDPGFPLVRDCLAQGLKVEALPGASALLPALQLSGLPTDRFTFLGFLPQKKNERLRFLADVATRVETIVLYESPYRIVEALGDMAQELGERPISVSRELTKLHEESLRGTAAEVAAVLEAKPSIKGEFVVVIGPAIKTAKEISEADIEKAIDEALLDLPSGKAASQVSKALGLPRDDIYARILQRKGHA
jgi:16S rRNA (cytidine1402-2'-O)-methyltransferase